MPKKDLPEVVDPDSLGGWFQTPNKDALHGDGSFSNSADSRLAEQRLAG